MLDNADRSLAWTMVIKSPSFRKAQDDSGVLYLKRLLAATLLEQDYTEEGVVS